MFDGATLEMFEVSEADPDLSNLDDTIDDATLGKGKGKGKRAREEGFGGTGLAGGWDESQERNDSVEIMDVDSGADVAGKEDTVDEDDHAIAPASGGKRPRRSAASAGGGGSTSGTNSKRSSASSNEKDFAGGKKRKEEMDVDEDEDEVREEVALACSLCTLINEPGVEVCIACETVLLPPGVTL